MKGLRNECGEKNVKKEGVTTTTEMMKRIDERGTR